MPDYGVKSEEMRKTITRDKENVIHQCQVAWGMNYNGSLSFQGYGFISIELAPHHFGLPSWGLPKGLQGVVEMGRGTTPRDTYLLVSGAFSTDPTMGVRSIQVEANGKMTQRINLEPMWACANRMVWFDQGFIVPEQSPVRLLAEKVTKNAAQVGLLGTCFSKLHEALKMDVGQPEGNPIPPPPAPKQQSPGKAFP